MSVQSIRLLFRFLLIAGIWFVMLLHMPEKCAAESVEELMRHVQFNREQLFSGEFDIVVTTSGRVTHPDGTVEVSSEKKWDASCVFDALAEKFLMRYWKSGEFRMHPAPITNPTVTLDRQSFISAVDGDQVMMFDSVSKSPKLIINRREEVFTHGYQLLPVDPRGMGLHSGLDQLYRRGMRLEDGLAYLMKDNPLNTLDPQIAVKGDLICWSHIYGRYNKTQQEVCFDPNQNYVVRSYRRYFGKTDPNSLTFTPTKTVYDAKIDWIKIDGVDVPTSYVEESWRRDIVSEGTGDFDTWTFDIHERTARMELTWKSVNQPIDQDQFDYHNFELPFGTLVFDRRGKESKFIERIENVPVRSDGVEIDVNPRLLTRLAFAFLATLSFALIWFLGRRMRRRMTKPE